MRKKSGRKSEKIRVLALGLIDRGDRLFLSQGYDPLTQETFYRPLGGGVDFGETSRAALQREFLEELQAELQAIEYLGCLESLFDYDGKPCHEIIQLYRCEFVDPKLYQSEQVTFMEGDRQKTALWVSLEQLQSGVLKLYPKNLLALIQKTDISHP
ncbi:MAG: NUDIX hydrolase [Oscillatoriales cyanobacterium RM2_1_1]|nr:NUDIX hydrolase [Oscillatoriales cyanobacterium RM2_1_1]